MRKGKRFYFVALAVCMVINSLSACLGGNVITARATEGESTTITIEGESYTEGSYVNQYTKDEYPDQAAGQFRNAKNAYAVYTVNVEIDGVYALTAIGTGAIVASSLTGDLYIDDNHVSQSAMNANGAYNVFAEGNALETELGSVELTAGQYTFKFVINGGVYVMDKMILTWTGEIPTTITVEGESYTGGSYVNQYTKAEYPDQAAGQFQNAKNAYAVYTITVETAGKYAFTAIGTGAIAASSLTGDLYIDDNHISQSAMNVNGAYNVFVSGNALETELGSADLTAGEHTIKFVVNGGVYVMDKMILTWTGEIESGGEGGGEGDETPIITIEGEDYTGSSQVEANAYTKPEYPDQAAVQMKYATDAYVSYTVTVETAGMYAFTTIGNGTPTAGYLTGDLYIDDVLKSENDLNNKNGYNVFANPSETALGEFALTAGEHTIKLVTNGGVYVLDKIILTWTGEIQSGGEGGGEGDETPIITVEGEDYTGSSQVETNAYTKPDYPDQAAVQMKYATDAYVSYTVTVETAGMYAFTITANGTPSAGYLTGDLYIDDTLKSETDINNKNGYNVFENPSETQLGEFALDEGEHTIKLVTNGGVVVLDKIVLTWTGEIVPGGGEGGETTPTITISGETYTGIPLNSDNYAPGGYADVKGVRIGVDMTKPSWVKWTVTVEEAGTYAIATHGNGYTADTNGPGILGGTLSVDGGTEVEVQLTVKGGQEYITNGSRSELGEFTLTKGEHTIILALAGGRYTLDDMFFTRTGSISSGTEAVVGGQAYNSFDEAFEVAKSKGDKLILCGNATASDALNIEDGSTVVVDLNGYALTASALLANGGGVIDNSAEKTGVLKVANGSMLLPADNSQMPVWNGTDGYVFATMKKQEANRSNAETGLFSIAFKPSFGTMFNGLFADGMKDNDVEVKVILTYTNGEGESKTQPFTYTEELIEMVYGNNKAFSFSARGLDAVTDVTVTTKVIGSGVEWQGDTYTISANE